MEGALAELIPALPLFVAMFVTIYLIGYFIVFRNWNPKLRPEASSCFISMAHGTPAVFLATYAILNDAHRSFASPNTKFQNVVIDYSAAYFITDLVHYVVFCRGDVMFIGHHMATVFAYFTCQIAAAHGAYAILMLLVLAEVTSLCQNIWTLSNARRADHRLAAKVYELLSPPFYTFYTLVRGFIAPVFAYQMANAYLSGAVDGIIPKWIWISWTFLVFLFIPVSILWIVNLWIELFRERKNRPAIEKKTG